MKLLKQQSFKGSIQIRDDSVTAYVDGIEFAFADTSTGETNVQIVNCEPFFIQLPLKVENNAKKKIWKTFKTSSL
jgi:hypothetical protein